jgi:epoxide hydrolase-like predicted phosphatase
MTYKAIGFDWGGVISGKPGKFFGLGMAKLLGISHAQYLDAYFHHNSEFNRGEIDQNELWTRVLNELKHIEKLDEVKQFVKEARTDHINDDVVALADQLRATGYKVGLLSNNTLEKAKEMRDTGIGEHFDVLHISAETGDVKPEPNSFIHFADDLGVKPNELIFIDDTEKSLSTASEVGFAPILFDDLAQCVKELKSLGINL